MDNENQTLDTNPETELGAPAAEGSQNDVVNQTTTPTLTLEEINALTGHNYSSVDEAKKGIDNLKRAVGKKEVVKEVVDPTLLEKVTALENEVFFANNPDLKPAKDLLSKFGSPAEAIKDPAIKAAVDALKVRDDSEQLKSTPRIDQPSADYQTDLQKAQKSGNWGEFLAKHKGIGVPKL